MADEKLYLVFEAQDFGSRGAPRLHRRAAFTSKILAEHVAKGAIGFVMGGEGTVVEVHVVDTMAQLCRVESAEVRERALAKLTDEEKGALGISK